MDMIWIWTIIIAFSLIIEFITLEMISIWLAVGGVVGLILSLFDAISVEVQIIVAIIVAVGCIIGLRRFALKFLHKSSENKKTEILLGKHVVVKQPIEENKAGTVKLNGVEWTAYSEQPINAGENAEVIEVNGNKLKVKKID